MTTNKRCYVILDRSRVLSDDIVIRDKKLLEELADSFGQLDFLSFPFLYDLDEEDARRNLPQDAQRLIVFSTLSKRAVCSLLRSLNPAMTDIPINYHRIITWDKKDFLAPITQSCDSNETAPRSRDLPQVVTFVEAPSQPRWYPIIDYSRCVGCLECVNFCLFGVYAVDEQQPLVIMPNACRDGCPACARVCPANAIVFPLYDDPYINGDKEPPVQATQSLSDELDRLIDESEQL